MPGGRIAGLLSRQKAPFWENCRKNGVVISISRYPIKLDNDEIKKTARKYGVVVVYNEVPLKIMSKRGHFLKFPLDIEGKQDYKTSWANCYMRKRQSCITLRDGKLYQCAHAAHILNFNHYFGLNLGAGESDYVDIYKIQNKSEIEDFLSKPFPFCRYCAPSKISRIEWGYSKKEIGEWT
jgi:hypothetical protein